MGPALNTYLKPKNFVSLSSVEVKTAPRVFPRVWISSLIIQGSKTLWGVYRSWKCLYIIMPLWCCFVSGLPLPELSEDIVWGYEKNMNNIRTWDQKSFFISMVVSCQYPMHASQFPKQQRNVGEIRWQVLFFFPFVFLLLFTGLDFWSCWKLFDMAKIIMGGKPQFKREIKGNYAYTHNKMSTQRNKLFMALQDGPMGSSNSERLERRRC